MEVINEKIIGCTVSSDIFGGQHRRAGMEAEMNFVDITPDQLRAATKAQILNFLNNKLADKSKLQLSRFILRVGDVDIDGLLEIPDPAITTEDHRGELTRVQSFRDISGNKMKTVKVEHMYYPTGEVHLIVLTELNSSDIEISRKTIEHFTDPKKQPIVT